MSEEEFIQMARKSGCTEDEIQGWIQFHEDSGIPFDDFAVEVKNID